MKKKIFTFLTLLLCVCSGAWADPTYKNDFTNNQIIVLSTTNVDEAITAGWMAKNTTSTGTVTASTPTTISNTTVYRVKSWKDKHIDFYVTGVSSIIFYANNPNSSSTRTLSATVNITNNSDVEDNHTNLVTITTGSGGSSLGSGTLNLTATANNFIRVYADADMDLYAIKVTVPAATEKPATPVFNPAAGSVPAESKISITSTGATTILYQWGSAAIDENGDWTGASTYSADNKPVVPAASAGTNVLSVKATNSFGDRYGSATYTITTPVVANPVLPTGGYFTDASKSIEITCATTGAAIQYSFDNLNWINYTGAFSITATTTVYAKATKTGYEDSGVVSATYLKADAGTTGEVTDLTAVSAGYTFIADNVTQAGKVKPGNKLYGNGKIYINGVGSSKTDKGSSTIGGDSYYNSINLTSGYVAFKTAGAVKVKIYGGNNNNRNFIIGTDADDDKYGEAPTGQIAWDVIIPEAATVRIKQKTSSNSGDYCLAGLEVSDVETISLNANGFATYSSANDFIFVGADAYKMALTLDDETPTGLTGTKIDANTKIKAGEGILFKGDVNATVTIASTTGAAALSDNDLKGTTTATGSLVAIGSDTYYALSGKTFKKFTGSAFADNKAYFEVTGTNAPSFLSFIFDDGEAGTTNIADVRSKMEEVRGEFFDLQGRKVTNPTKGLYIVNGKKYAIK